MVLSDRICERPDPGLCPPMTMPKHVAGFPQPAVSRGFPETILSEAGSECFRMSTRDAAKLEWTNPIDETEGSSSVRYDFEGNITSCSETGSYTKELYHHGEEPGKPGYTLSELFHLSQSGFPSQKTLAIRSIGAIAAKSKAAVRQMHRVLIGEWKAHIRCSVACSDTSVNVREAAIDSLLKLIEGVDKQCGCVASDLGSIPEFLRAFDSDSETSVKVFLHVVNSGLQTIHESVEEDETDAMREFILESAIRFGLDPKSFKCGIPAKARDLITNSEESVGEILATLCDRLACAHEEAISDEDVKYFESVLGTVSANFPLFKEEDGTVDEFSWTSRCNLVAQALTESAGSEIFAQFLAKICWLFTSSLFPLECRAAIWGNTELMQNISRIMSKQSTLKLLHNHEKLDFCLKDIVDLHRDKAMILRAIKNACTSFLEESGEESCFEVLAVAKGILSGNVGKI